MTSNWLQSAGDRPTTSFGSIPDSRTRKDRTLQPRSAQARGENRRSRISRPAGNVPQVHDRSRARNRLEVSDPDRRALHGHARLGHSAGLRHGPDPRCGAFAANRHHGRCHQGGPFLDSMSTYVLTLIGMQFRGHHGVYAEETAQMNQPFEVTVKPCPPCRSRKSATRSPGWSDYCPGPRRRSGRSSRVPPHRLIETVADLVATDLLQSFFPLSNGSRSRCSEAEAAADLVPSGGVSPRHPNPAPADETGRNRVRANIGDRWGTIEKALAAPGADVWRTSGRSRAIGRRHGSPAPVGVVDQPVFGLEAVEVEDTSPVPPKRLPFVLQEIEHAAWPARAFEEQLDGDRGPSIWICSSSRERLGTAPTSSFPIPDCGKGPSSPNPCANC